MLLIYVYFILMVYIQHKNANFIGFIHCTNPFYRSNEFKVSVVGSWKKNINFIAKNEMKELKFLESMENINKI